MQFWFSSIRLKVLLYIGIAGWCNFFTQILPLVELAGELFFVIGWSTATLQIRPHGSFEKRWTLNISTSCRMTLETTISLFAVGKVHIREAGDSSSSAPIFSIPGLGTRVFCLSLLTDPQGPGDQWPHGSAIYIPFSYDQRSCSTRVFIFLELESKLRTSCLVIPLDAPKVQEVFTHIRTGFIEVKTGCSFVTFSVEEYRCLQI